MSTVRRIRTALRGDVSAADVAREIAHRRKNARRLQQQRGEIDRIRDEAARLVTSIQRLGEQDLAAHFRTNERPHFWLQSDITSFGQGDAHAVRLLAEEVVSGSWQVAGIQITYGEDDFWRRDPLTGQDWGLDFHADIGLQRQDGVDVRILWELNRLGHVIPLAQAYAATGDETFAETFYSHIADWIEQNPYGRGANWASAMEVALRAANVLAAFDLGRRSASLTGERLHVLLKFFDQHGRFITDNSEFSYIATSNHYLANVVGLFWIGTLLPELENAGEWQRHGLSEMLSEMDKQVLPDGADYESSTGYHRFVTEMLYHSFALAERNNISLPDAHSAKLAQMLRYVSGITKPDGTIPLIGDADGSRFIQALTQPSGEALTSLAFHNAGSYVLRNEDLYLHFNTSDCGLKGRGSHAHNDALSIDVFALGRTFIVDPGTYVYNLDRSERHRFRSTAYHSTVMIDGTEQNTTPIDRPFIIGNEARPRVTRCELGGEIEVVTAEHRGYERLPEPVVHRRTVRFFRTARCWSIRDHVSGRGQHEVAVTFHIAPGIQVDVTERRMVRLFDHGSGQLVIHPHGIDQTPKLISAWSSKTYGHKEPSTLLTWTINASIPFSAEFLLIPVAANENPHDRVANAIDLTENIDD